MFAELERSGTFESTSYRTIESIPNLVRLQDCRESFLEHTLPKYESSIIPVSLAWLEPVLYIIIIIFYLVFIYWY